jgi:hypothetical protein
MKERSGAVASTKRRYSKEEFAQRGDAVYESSVRPHLKPEDKDKFAAIDIETGEYEIDADDLEAMERLGKRVPAAQIWLVRIGSRYLVRFGGREQRGTK